MFARLVILFNLISSTVVIYEDTGFKTLRQYVVSGMVKEDAVRDIDVVGSDVGPIILG